MIAICVAVFALFMGVRPAPAGEAGKDALKRFHLAWPTLIPPPEYDHPLQGVLMVVRAGKSEMAKRCILSNRVGCAYPFTAGGCEITIADDELLQIYHVPYVLVYRHEIAHCNGWPADHPMHPPSTPRVMPIPTKPVDTPVILLRDNKRAKPCDDTFDGQWWGADCALPQEQPQ